MFGTSDGQLIVMSSTGAMVSQVTINEGFEITSMTWSCEKFNMEEADNRGGAPYGQRSLEGRGLRTQNKIKQEQVSKNSSCSLRFFGVIFPSP